MNDLARPPFPEVLDATMRRTFVSCPRKWFYSFLLRRASETESIHLRAGRAFADGMEAARLAYWGDGASQQESLYAGAKALIRSYGAPDDQAREEGTFKTIENLLLALEEYFIVWGWKTDRIQPIMHDGKPAVEFSFALPMELNHPETGQPLLYHGRFDMLGIDNNNVAWGVDEKTAKQMGGAWKNNWPLRDQFMGYTYGARAYGYDIAGAIIRGLALQAKAIQTQEVPVPFPAWMLDRWWMQLHEDAARMIAAWQRGYYDYNFGESCTSYGKCLFFEACLSKRPLRWVEANTVERTWNPVHP